MTKNSHPQSLLAWVLLLPCLASVTEAQQASRYLEELIVTAQKREQSLQDVSVSVNVLEGQKLQDAGITKIEDLQAYVPNLSMSETGIGTSIFMRGIGSGNNQGFEQSVGLYKDGVYYGRAQLSRAPFLDLERVEVLRGPQNILYGRNSIAGAVSLISAPPTKEFAGSVSATYEPDHGERIFDVVLSGPLTDTLSGRLAHRSRQLDGYVQNLDAGEEPDRDEQTTRLSLLWEPTEGFDASMTYEKGDFDVHGRQIEILGDARSPLTGATWGQFLLGAGGLGMSSQTPPSVLNGTQDFNRSSNGDSSLNNTETLTLTMNLMMHDIKLTSITSSLTYDYAELCDCDFTSANIFFLESGEDYEQISQEIRLTSPGGQTVDWIAGIYYQTSDLDFNERFFTNSGSVLGNVLDGVLPSLFRQRTGVDIYPVGAAQQLNNFAAPRVFAQDSDLWSVFVQATWNLNEATRITLGGRHYSEDKDATRVLNFSDADGNSLPFNDLFLPNTTAGIDFLVGQVLNAVRHDLSGSREESKFAPAATFEYDFSGDAMGYASWSRGFKAGGYDVRSNKPPVAALFNPAFPLLVEAGVFEYDRERSETFELGLKSSLLGGNLELNVAAFLTDYEDLQVSIYDGAFGFNVGNAAEATSKGIELDGRWGVSEHLVLSGAIAWLDFEFDRYPNGQCTQAVTLQTGATLCEYAGLTNQYVADFTGFLSADYRRDLSSNLQLRTFVDLIYSSDYNPAANLDPLIEQDGYTKINLRIALGDPDGIWEVALLGKNLTDEDIVTFAGDAPLSASLTGSIGHYGFVEPPQTFALQGTYRF